MSYQIHTYGLNPSHSRITKQVLRGVDFPRLGITRVLVYKVSDVDDLPSMHLYAEVDVLNRIMSPLIEIP